MGLSASCLPVSPSNSSYRSEDTLHPATPAAGSSHSLPGLRAPTLGLWNLPSPLKLTPGLNVSSAPEPRAPKEGAKVVTFSLWPSEAPTTPPLGGRAPLPAAAGSRGVPTATSNQRVEHRAAILAQGHGACATRLKEASRGQRAAAATELPEAGPGARARTNTGVTHAQWSRTRSGTQCVFFANAEMRFALKSATRYTGPEEPRHSVLGGKIVPYLCKDVFEGSQV